MESPRLRMAKASIAGVLIVLLAAPLAHAAPVEEPQEQRQQQPAPATPQPSQPPDANPPSTNPQNPPEAPSPQLADPATRPSNPQSDQQQNSHPVGTAVAPAVKPTGVAASRPAGAVIAPGKQRRMRTILIRVGIIVGAGVAIGTVAALSRSSPARP
jgi:hypothetical protein